jgi:mgtE-like transporter
MAYRKLHWKAKAIVDKDFREIFSAEIISVTGGVLAGFLLAVILDKILLIPGIFIFLPGFLELRGNISGSLAARLGTALDVGKIKPKYIQRFTIENFAATFIEVLFVALALAAIAFLLTYFLFGVAVPSLFLIALVASLVSNLVESSLTILTTIWLFKKGHDPNNIMGPYVTTTGDIVGVLSLMLAIWLV